MRIKSHKENKLCALRAIIVEKAISDKDADYDSIRDTRYTYQNDRALEIAESLVVLVIPVLLHVALESLVALVALESPVRRQWHLR